MNIYFDTSTLREVGLYSKPMQMLDRLIDYGASIVIPEFIIKELSTGVHKDFVEQLPPKNILRCLKCIEREYLDAVGASHALEVLRKDQSLWVREMTERSIREWLSERGGRAPEICGQAAKAAWDSYFMGTGMFEHSPKNRNHLPDAMILELIKADLSDGDNVFIVGDGDLRNAASKIPNLHVFSDLHSFIKSDTAEQYMAEFETEEPARLTELLEAAKEYGMLDKEKIKERITQQVVDEKLMPATIDYMPYGEELNIIDVEFDEPEILLNEASLYGHDSLIIPVNITSVHATVEIFMPKSEYWTMDESELANTTVVDTDWNRHVVRMETEVKFKLKTEWVLDFSEEDDSGIKPEGSDLLHSTLEIYRDN